MVMRFYGSRMVLCFCLVGISAACGDASWAIADGLTVARRVVSQAGTGATVSQPPDAIAQLFEQGMQQYQQGQLKLALQTFEAVLARLEGKKLTASQQQQRAE